MNPELGFADDERYDPCRPHSKLGVPLSDFSRLPKRFVAAIRQSRAYTYTATANQKTSAQLETTVEQIQGALEELEHLSWVNLGGGYYLGPEIDASHLERAVRSLTERFGVDVFIEPGTALVQQAGMLVTEVLDVFQERWERVVAVIDATTSHMPEVFEYGFYSVDFGPL